MTLLQIESHKVGFTSKVVSLINHKKIKWVIEIVILMSIVAISIYLFHPNLKATWSIIDDHEIMYFVGDDGVFGFSEIIPTLLIKTEINPSSPLARFRPVYYLFRLIETRLWVNVGPIGWYVSRIFVFCFFLLSVYWFFKGLHGQLAAGALTLLISNFSFWDDVISRLGPSETYVLLGIGIFLIGVILLWKEPENPLAWLLLLLATIICLGSKENLVIILYPLFLIFYSYLRKNFKGRLLPSFLIVTSILMTTGIFFVINSRIKSSSSDIYENTINLSDRLILLRDFSQDHLGLSIFLIFLLITITIWRFLTKDKRIILILQHSLIIYSLVIALIISQLLFYNGNITKRYAVPFSFYLPILLSLLLYAFQRLMDTNQCRRITWIGLLVTIVIVGFIIQPEEWRNVHDRSMKAAMDSKEFSETLDQISYYALQNPNSPIIIYGNYAINNYERSISYSRFLSSRGVTNPYIILRGAPNNADWDDSPLSVKIENVLRDFSEKGSEEYGFVPINELDDKNGNCLLITLMADKPSPIKCDYVVKGK